jgi:hypothetical protein
MPCIFALFVLAAVLWHGVAQHAQSSLSLGLFVQVGNINKLNDVMQCVGNVVQAKKLLDKNPEKWLTVQGAPVKTFTIDVYVSHVIHQPGTNHTEFSKIEAQLRHFGQLVRNYYISDTENVGLDVGQFLLQLKSSQLMRKSYDVALKIHSKSHKEWAQHTHECLCGTPAHVISILNQFIK